MAILKVARLGHPILREVGKKLTAKEIASPDVQRLIDDMIETMHEYDGVGLAAPQVHESLQIAVMEIAADNPRYADETEESPVDTENGVPVTVFINPVLTALTEETMEIWEGCLSVPGMRGAVRRPKKIKLEALDRDGKKFERIFEGFPAIAVQHETDHLFGKLYVDRLVSTEKFSYSEEYLRYHLPVDEEDLEV